MELMIWNNYCLAGCVRQKQDPMPDVHIMYEDQPYCDFKSLFLMANGGYAKQTLHDSKVHGVTVGPIWGRHDPAGSHVGPINLAIWAVL